MDNPIRTGVHMVTKRAVEDDNLLSGRYWGELRTFLAVAKAKSLNKAAQELGVSRMTAGREIRRLQDAIGAQLVVFGKTGAGLTGRGEELARGLQRLDQEIHTLTYDMRGEVKSAEGTVRVSVMDGVGMVFVVPVLNRLAKEYPRIRVEMKSTNTYLSILDGHTDIIVGFNRDDHIDLTSTQMGTFHFRPFASRDYVERRGVPTVDDLERHHFIDFARFYSNAEAWKPWRNLVRRGYVSHCCDASFAYSMMVKTGLGVGLLGNFNIMEPTLVPLDLDCTIAFPLFATAFTERLQAKPVRIVFDFVESLFGPDNPWFADDMKCDATRATPFDEGYRALFNL